MSLDRGALRAHMDRRARSAVIFLLRRADGFGPAPPALQVPTVAERIQRLRSNPTRDQRRRYPECRFVSDPRRRSPRPGVAGPLERPNALASAARAPSISQTDARRRRPCRLHAVIRTLALDRPGTLGRRRRAARPQGTAGLLSPDPRRSTHGARRALSGGPCPRRRDLSASTRRWLWARAASAPGADLR